MAKSFHFPHWDTDNHYICFFFFLFSIVGNACVHIFKKYSQGKFNSGEIIWSAGKNLADFDILHTVWTKQIFDILHSKFCTEFAFASTSTKFALAIAMSITTTCVRCVYEHGHLWFKGAHDNGGRENRPFFKNS